VRRPVVAIHQPNYLPWIGFFAKARAADVLVLLDDVQLERAGPTQRTRVKAPEGPRWLTVPVQRTAGNGPAIREAKIAHDGKWDRHHARVLENAYSRSPGWGAHGPPILEVLTSGEVLLPVLNERLLGLLFAALGIGTRVVRASDLGPRGERGNLGNLELCRRLGAATYLSGSGARAYNDPAPFAAAGIDLVYHEFVHPRYAQPHGPFVPGLSAVDYLFSVPPGRSGGDPSLTAG
jgi:hypothetical protein